MFGWSHRALTRYTGDEKQSNIVPSPALQSDFFWLLSIFQSGLNNRNASASSTRLSLGPR